MWEYITKVIQASPVVEGGMVLMVAGWIGYQVRELPSRIFWFIRAFSTRVLQIRSDNPLYETWLEVLTEGALRRGGPRVLEVRAMRRRSDDAPNESKFVAGNALFWTRVCGKWCRAFVRRENQNGTITYDQRFIITVEIVWITRNELTKMMEMVKQRADVRPDRLRVDICDKNGSRTRMTLPKRQPRTLCLPQGFYEQIESRVGEFYDSRCDYESVGIPWRFGILLYGSPGTGKTSIVHTLASSTDRRLSVIPLADVRSDEELVTAFEAVRDGSIVLLEDIDCVFQKRKKTRSEGMTFSGLLNCIDGLLAPQNGRVLVMSTNHLERLDPALIRPGRVDLRLEVPTLSRETAEDYVDRVFPHVAARHEVVQRVMQLEQPTPAELINQLMRADWRRSRTVRPGAETADRDVKALIEA